MAKRRGKVYPRLGLTLLKYFVFALIGAGIITAGIAGIAYVTANEVVLENTKQDTLAKSVEEFQAYVTQERAYSTDVGTIRKWNQKNFLMVFVLHDQFILYSTENRSGSDRGQPYDSAKFSVNSPDFTVKFEDKTCTMTVLKFYHMPFQAVWGILIYVIPFISFITIFSAFLQTKIRYIHALEEGIHIIEGGGLEYRIPIKGSDELTSLAESINAMSEAMGERIRSEEEEKKQEFDLVASISHDIRTPLTTAICYLDLVHDKKFSSAQQEAQYVENAREKVHHIKFLTDNLFEHSIQGADSAVLHRELLDGNELMNQLLSEWIFLLEDKGFRVKAEQKLAVPFRVEVDATEIRRVFDNLASNIFKYADPTKPVQLFARIHKDYLIIQQENSMRARNEEDESFGIGLKNCIRILSAHKGSLEAGSRGNKYQIILRLPLA